MKYVVFIILLFTGCATTSQFENLEIGMNKSRVKESIGNPDLARASIKNRYGQLIEVWEYERLASNWSWDKKKMWLYFSDGKLIQWGQAGDWKKEADRIYEIRYE